MKENIMIINRRKEEEMDNWLDVISRKKPTSRKRAKELGRDMNNEKNKRKVMKGEDENKNGRDGARKKCHCKKPCALNNHDLCNTPNCRMKMLLINYPKLENLHGEKIDYEEWMAIIKTLKAQVQDETSTVHLCVLETVVLLSMYALADYINHVTPEQLRKAYYQFVDILNLFSSHSIINELKKRYKIRNTPLARIATIWIELHIEDEYTKALEHVNKELERMVGTTNEMLKKPSGMNNDESDDDDGEEEEEIFRPEAYYLENLARPNEHQLVCFLYFTRGYIYDKMNIGKAALGDYTRSLEYNIHSSLTLAHRGTLLFEREFFDAARMDLYNAIHLDTEYVPALIQLGQLLEDPFEEQGKAIDIYERILKVEPGHVYAKAYRDSILYEVAQCTASVLTL